MTRVSNAVVGCTQSNCRLSTRLRVRRRRWGKVLAAEMMEDSASKCVTFTTYLQPIKDSTYSSVNLYRFFLSQECHNTAKDRTCSYVMGSLCPQLAIDPVSCACRLAGPPGSFAARSMMAITTT